MDGPGIVCKDMDGIPGAIGAEREWQSGADPVAIRYAVGITFCPDHITGGIAVYWHGNGQGQTPRLYDIAVGCKHVKHGRSVSGLSLYLPGDVQTVPVCMEDYPACVTLIRLIKLFIMSFIIAVQKMAADGIVEGCCGEDGIGDDDPCLTDRVQRLGPGPELIPDKNSVRKEFSGVPVGQDFQFHASVGDRKIIFVGGLQKYGYRFAGAMLLLIHTGFEVN